MNNCVSNFASAYKFAIIHLLWSVLEGERHLVFGLVEMYPSELDFEEVYELEEQNEKFPYNKKTYRLFYIRYKEKDVNKAIEWYRNIKENKKIDLYWDLDKDGNLKNFTCEQMIDIRTWPNFELSKKVKEKSQQNYKEDKGLPFVADAWGVVRTHHLYPEVYKDQEIYDLLANKTGVLEWIEKHLMWNIGFYEELIGSVHLVLPNPLYSNRRIRVIPKTDSIERSYGQVGNSDTGRTDVDEVRITFTPRKGMSLENLMVYYCEKTNTGITLGQGSKVIDNFCRIPLIGKEDNFSFYFKDSNYGLIDYTDSASFILGIRLDVGVASREKLIHVNNSINTVVEYENVSTMDIGCTNNEHADATTLQDKITDEDWKRRKHYEGQKYGQKIFQNHEEAKQCIKEIIHNAKNKLIFVDPYITITEFFEYALETTRRDIRVILLMGKDDFKKNQTPEIMERIKNIATQENIEILGMTGQPIIHDRFIVVDDDVWIIGGSLNFIGKRLSVMLKAPDPKPLKECLYKIIYGQNVRDFNDWYNESSPVEKKTLMDKIRKLFKCWRIK